MPPHAERSTNDNDVAIVGMALRVPGARNVAEFWANLRNGVESIRSLSDEELLAAGESQERMRHPRYVRATADLEAMEMFDAAFFGLSPKEAAIMDPQHRHFLECAWEALEDAGRPPSARSGPVGVFAGCGMGSYFYFNVCSHRELVDSVGLFLLRHTGNDKDFLATRTSHAFDLRGPSVNVQTACSTSMVAVHYAAQSLLSGECDMALAGGVTIELPHRRGYVYEQGEILSPDGHCHAFDHRAAGTVFGSGVGVVVLRRLADALADGDPIHAVIKATAVNNDGADKAGYLAPSVTGQSGAILEAQGLAGITADTIQYVECHGTGTYLGDPIEIEALTQAFRRSTSAKGFCRIGSVKTNIGHLDTAAGVVSLIKAALAIEHGEIPPSLGFERPNPTIDFDGSPFVVNAALAPWPETSGPRRAGVNSLGVGGTNAHAILEQAPPRPARAREGDDGGPELLVLSAKQRKALDQAAERLADHLERHPELPLADVSYTLFAGRRHFERRRVLAVRDRAEAIALLRDPDVRRVHTHSVVEDAPSAVFLFPGGGAQHPGMAKGLYESEADFRATVDEGLGYLPDDDAKAIRALWLERSPADGDAARAFLRPSLQLPAILVVEVAMARLWMSWGVKPAALIGHSMGENAAACIASVLSFRDAVGLVHLRGTLFDSVSGGGMLSVPLSPAEVVDRMPASLDLATVNAPSLCVVSGPKEAIDAFQEELAAEGVEARAVAIDVAAHSRLLDPILEPFTDFLRRVELAAPRIPIVSNRTGTFLTDAEATSPTYWARHLRETVRFAEGMLALSANPSHVYVEVGPGKVLSSLVKAQGNVPPNQVLNSLPHPDDPTDDTLHFLTALGRAFATGLPVDLDALWDADVSRRVALPAYPFQHQSYFLERVTPKRDEGDDAPLEKRADLATWGYRPTWKRALPEHVDDEDAAPNRWLVFLDDAGIGARVVARLRSLGHAVATVTPGDGFAKRGDDAYVLSPEHGREGYDALVRDLLATGRAPDRVVHLWLVTQDQSFRPGSSFFHRNQERGFYSLFFLAQALGDENAPRPLHLTVVTNGMQRVDDEPLPYPEKATVLGPSQVIPKELPGVSARVIDLTLPEAPRRELGARLKSVAAAVLSGRHPAAAALDDLAEALLDDLVAEPANELVAYRDGQRWVRAYRALRLPPEEQGLERLRERGVYLLTGGSGDLALVIAEALARKVHARVVLVGRTRLPEPALFAEYLRVHGAEGRVGRTLAAIQRIEALGGEALYLTADVSHLEQMRDALARARDRFGEIHGVVHAAGRIKDELVQLKAAQEIEEVFTPKIHGTAVLADLFAGTPLDFFVLFSSTSTDTAPAGQVDYVAANAYMNAFAASRGDDGTTMALHWGVWNEVGLAARALRGDDAGDTGERLRATREPLFDEWVEDASGVLWLEGAFSTATHWLLDEHRTRSGDALVPGTGYFELMAEALEEHDERGAFEVENLLFLRPLQVPDGEVRPVRVRLERSKDGYAFVVKSACEVDGKVGFQRHAQAVLRVVPQSIPVTIDLASIDARCTARRETAGSVALVSAQEAHLRFGPRWRVLRSVAIGEREALARLELPTEYRSDLERYHVHPALLDLATGFAMALVDGYDPDACLWVPVSYERVRVHRRLPAVVHSWVRSAGDNQAGAGFAAFDVTITDEQGRTLLEVERFVVKRLGDEGFTFTAASTQDVEPESLGRRFELVAPRQRNAPPKGDDPSPAAARLAAQVERGILPAEGAEAFVRVLGAIGRPEVVVSSMDLELLRKKAAAQTALAAPTGRFERPDLESEYIAPSDDVERALVGFWEELLGVERIGIRDGFFDLGGHSLVAVRLFGMVRKAFAVDFPISVLFEAPTIERCAELIRRARADQGAEGPIEVKVHEARFEHLVAMHPSEGRTKTPFFLCAGMFGNVLNLRHLAHLIGTDRPFYGLQARGLYGDKAPHETFEAMAKDYIAEIRSVQPRGPYLLGGFSGGGITAYEMAQELTRQGDEVSLLVMLDTPLPTQPELTLADRLEMKWQRLVNEGPGYVSAWARGRLEWELARLRRRLEENAPPAAEQFHNEAIEAAFRAALPRYAIEPYAGRVALFRPKLRVAYRLRGNRWLSATRQFLYEDNGWTKLVRDLAVYEVPGDHDSMVLEPNVRVLAEKIRACIERAEGDAQTLRAAAE